MALRNETAAPGVGPRSGGKTEKLGGIFHHQIYGTAALSSMPSAEVTGKVAFVVARGGKLFLVGAYPAGGAL